MSRRLLIATRQLAGLSGKVLLIQRNLPALVAAGWDVHVLAEKCDRAALATLGVQVHKAARGWWPRARRLQRFSERATRLARDIHADLVVGHGDTRGQDVLHVHLCPHRQHLAITGQELRRGESPDADLLEDMLRAREFRRVVANSGLMRDELAQCYAVPAEAISVVYPGYDPARFQPGRASAAAALRAQLGVGESGLLVGLITSGDFRTRATDQFLQAMAQLPSALRDRLSLLIVGKDRIAPYEKLGAELGLARQMHFLAPREEVEQFYQALDLYVHPAHFESFGMSVLEALACEVPVLATRATGVTELFPPVLDEWRLNSAARDEIAGKTRRLLESAELRRSCAAQARAAIQHLSWEHNAQQHLALYEQALAAKRSAA